MTIAWKITIVFCLFLLCSVVYAILDDFDIFYLFNNKANNYPILSYKQFIDYYWVNPDKWILCDDYVQYKKKEEEISDNIIMTKMWLLNQTRNNSAFENIANFNGAVKFSFSFIDQLKYRKFKHDIEANKTKIKQSKAHNKAYQILLEGVQEDIDKLRKQSQDEINQAVGVMKEVNERIG